MEHQVFGTTYPLIQHKLAFLGDKNTGFKEPRGLVGEIAMLMRYEATRDLPLEGTQVETPVVVATTEVLSGHKLTFVPILRAGPDIVDAVFELVPVAKVGHISLHRDHEILQPVEYYSKLPQDTSERDVVVLDPMPATGSSTVDAINIIKRSHPKSIKSMCVIVAPEGVEALGKAHPDVPIHCAYTDDYLNGSGYIVLGPGDAGDRIFGTL